MSEPKFETVIKWYKNYIEKYDTDTYEIFDCYNKGKACYMSDSIWGTETQLNSLVKKLYNAKIKPHKYRIIPGNTGICIVTVPGKHMTQINRIIKKVFKKKVWWAYSYDV